MPPKTHVKSAVIQQQKITTENSYDNLDLINQCLKIMIFHAYKNSTLPFNIKYNHTSRPIFPMLNYKSCYSFHILVASQYQQFPVWAYWLRTASKVHPLHIDPNLWPQISNSFKRRKWLGHWVRGEGGKKHYIFLQGQVHEPFLSHLAALLKWVRPYCCFEVIQY